MLDQLLNSRKVFVPSNAGRNGDDVLRSEHFCGHAFVFNSAGFADSFLGEPGRGEKLNRESVDEKMLALHSPAAFLQVRVDRRNASGQPFLGGDEDDVGVVGGEWFDVVDRGQRATEGVVFDQAGSDEIIGGAKNIRQGMAGGSSLISEAKFVSAACRNQQAGSLCSPERGHAFA